MVQVQLQGSCRTNLSTHKVIREATKIAKYDSLLSLVSLLLIVSTGFSSGVMLRWASDCSRTRWRIAADISLRWRMALPESHYDVETWNHLARNLDAP